MGNLHLLSTLPVYCPPLLTLLRLTPRPLRATSPPTTRARGGSVTARRSASTWPETSRRTLATTPLATETRAGTWPHRNPLLWLIWSTGPNHWWLQKLVVNLHKCHQVESCTGAVYASHQLMACADTSAEGWYFKRHFWRQELLSVSRKVLLQMTTAI